MFSEFARKAQIFMQKKKESYNLQNFNETLIKYNNELMSESCLNESISESQSWIVLDL